MANAEISNKLAWVSRNLAGTQAIIAKDNLKPLEKRMILAHTLDKFIDEINKNIGVLPNSVKFEDKNITSELKYIRTNAVGLMQALQDKQLTTAGVKTRLKPVRAKLRATRELIDNNIAKYIIADENREGRTVKDIKQNVVKKVIAADRPKKILYDLADLSQVDFNQMMRDEIAKDAGLHEEKDQSAVIDPNNADEYIKSYDRPIENFTHNQNKYEENVNKNVLQTKNNVEDVASQLPKSITFNKNGYAIVKSPLLCVTQHFIPDSALHKAGIKFMRISGSFNPGYAPGLSTTKGVSVNYIIFTNQLLLVFPLAAIKNVADEYKDIMRNMERSLGKMVPVAFGKTPDNKMGDEKIFPKDRRFVFGNERFSGKAFIWIVPHQMYGAIASTSYMQVGLPTSNMKDSIAPDSSHLPKGTPDPLIKQKKDIEQAQDKRLARLKDRVAEWDKQSKPYSDTLMKLEGAKKSAKKTMDDGIEKVYDINNTITKQTDALKSMKLNSPQFKAQVAAINIKQAELGQAKLDLERAKEQLNAIEKNRAFLRGKLKEMMRNFHKVVPLLT